MNDKTREEFEQTFPKPLAIFWDDELQQYEPYDDDNSRADEAAEEYHAAYCIWQAAKERYAPKWVSVAERMPTVNEYVLFLDGGKTMGYHPPFVHVDKINNRNECQRSYLHNYSHWMPLPETANE